MTLWLTVRHRGYKYVCVADGAGRTYLKISDISSVAVLRSQARVHSHVSDVTHMSALALGAVRVADLLKDTAFLLESAVKTVSRHNFRGGDCSLVKSTAHTFIVHKSGTCSQHLKEGLDRVA